MKTNVRPDFEYLVVFDLQIFADVVVPENAAGNMNTTTSEGLTADQKSAMNEEFIRKATGALVFNKYAKKLNIAKRKGKKLELFKIGRTDPKNTKQLVEGLTPDPSKMSLESFEIPVAQYGDWMIFTDELLTTSLHELFREGKRMLARQLAETYNTFTYEHLVANAHRVYCRPINADGTLGERPTGTTEVTDTCRLSLKTIVRVVAMLKADDIPGVVGDDYIMYIHPHNWHDLILDPDWQKFHLNDSSNMQSGELGRIANCRFIDSSQITITKGKVTIDGADGEEEVVVGGGADGSIPLYHNVILGGNAYAVVDIANKGIRAIDKELGDGGVDDPLDQRASTGGKFWWGCGIIDDLAIYDVVCTSDEFASEFDDDETEEEEEEETTA